MPSKYVTIPVHEDTKKRLAELMKGKKTWDDLLNDLADSYERKNK